MTIDELPLASTLSGTDKFPVKQSVTAYCTLLTLMTYLLDNFEFAQVTGLTPGPAFNLLASTTSPSKAISYQVGDYIIGQDIGGTGARTFYIFNANTSYLLFTIDAAGVTTFTANTEVHAPNVTLADNSTKLANTAYVYGTINALLNSASGGYTTLGGIQTIVTALQGTVSSLASTVAGITLAEATASNVWNNTAGVFISPNSVALANAPVSLSYSSSIALNFHAGLNFIIGPLTGALTLANPTNMSPGLSFWVKIPQGSVGSKTVSYGSYFYFSQGTVPTASTAPYAIDILYGNILPGNIIDSYLNTNILT